MGDIAIAGMVVMGMGCVTLGVLGTLAICYARTFAGKVTKDNVEIKSGLGGDTAIPKDG